MKEEARVIVKEIQRCERDIDNYTHTLNAMYKGRKVTYGSNTYEIISITNASGLNLYVGTNGVGTRCLDFQSVLNGQAVVE